MAAQTAPRPPPPRAGFSDIITAVAAFANPATTSTPARPGTPTARTWPQAPATILKRAAIFKAAHNADSARPVIAAHGARTARSASLVRCGAVVGRRGIGVEFEQARDRLERVMSAGEQRGLPQCAAPVPRDRLRFRQRRGLHVEEAVLYRSGISHQ
jgi:hypothetical protein